VQGLYRIQAACSSAGISICADVYASTVSSTISVGFDGPQPPNVDVFKARFRMAVAGASQLSVDQVVNIVVNSGAASNGFMALFNILGTSDAQSSVAASSAVVQTAATSTLFNAQIQSIIGTEYAAKTIMMDGVTRNVAIAAATPAMQQSTTTTIVTTRAAATATGPVLVGTPFPSMAPGISIHQLLASAIAASVFAVLMSTV